MQIERTPQKIEPEDGVFVFVVYPSPQKTGEVFGYLDASLVESENEVTFLKSDFGVPVQKAFEQVLKSAEHYKPEKLIISDPEGLFKDWSDYVSN
ncbi:MAG: hypothetical protein ACFHHU_00530 [Porticoccaceae bacterium]